MFHAIARCRRGFSLVELLVVIIVIAILLAVLLPALGAARASSRAAKCQANLRSQTQSVLAYGNSYRDAMPPLGVWWNRRIADGEFENSYWSFARYLAELDGQPFDAEPDTPFFHPTGMWRCCEIRRDDDEGYTTHQTWVHSAPNAWVGSFASVDDETGDRSFTNNTLAGWEGVLEGAWRRNTDFPRPSYLIAVTDAVRFYFAMHSHWHARETIGWTWQVVPGTSVTNSITHARVGALPAAYLDGHAAAPPWRTEYWQDVPRDLTSPAGATTQTYDREVKSLMWFIDR